MDMNYKTQFSHSTVTSSDGARIGYHSVGSGPGLMIIPGALCTALDYAEIALCLAAEFTVHIIDRRGRGLSDPQGGDYSIAKEVEDALAVQSATVSKYLFATSFGGLVSLELLRTNEIFHKVVLFEPGVSQGTNWSWIKKYEMHMDQKRYRHAFVEFVIGMGRTPLSSMPRWLADFILKVMIKGKHWEKIEGLLPENLKEHKEVQVLESKNFDRYRDIDTQVLFLSGGKSLQFVQDMNVSLKRTLKNSSVDILPRLDHMAPENTRQSKVLANSIKEYFHKK
jgi:pimeloyl-ACP methyl ester carboxylesterase